jgi:NAD(P)-dependent dehydrogenase (short-subunit alcohol dehydrogenase family)
VIGGTSGIGRTISLGLADAGADVTASARRQELVEETAAEIERRGRQTLRLSSDLRNRASLEQLFVASLQRFGKVDILINCAGKIKRMPTLTMPEEEWADILDTNLTGTLRACQIFGEHMLGAWLRPHRQHRLAQQLRCAQRSRRLRGQQGWCCLADALACRGVVEAGSYRERDRAGRLPYYP